MTVYKITEKGMTATRGKGNCKLKMGVNVAEKANCAREGFHAAENPLDCFNYYSASADNEYYLCEARGDIDEDSVDTKISCTHLTLKKKLTLKEFIIHALFYISKHPKAAEHQLIKKNKGEAINGFVIVAGENPKAKGDREGDILAYVQKVSPENVRIFCFAVDCKKTQPGVWYDMNGKAVTK